MPISKAGRGPFEVRTQARAHLLEVSDADLVDKLAEYDTHVAASTTDAHGITNISGLELVLTGKVDVDGDKVLSDLNFTSTMNSTLSSALQSHQDISGKVDVDGDKVLSDNNLTDELVSTIGSALQSHQDISGKVDNSRVLTDVPTDALFTDTVPSGYTGSVSVVISVDFAAETVETKTITYADGQVTKVE